MIFVTIKKEVTPCITQVLFDDFRVSCRPAQDRQDRTGERCCGAQRSVGKSGSARPGGTPFTVRGARVENAPDESL